MEQVRAVHGAVLELIVFPPTSNSCNICEAILKDRFANSNESKKRADLNLLRILSTWCVRMCEAVDLLLKGKNLEALDMLVARFKACQQRAKDGNWAAAKWFELIPPSESHLAFNADEEDTVRGIQVHEARAAAQIAKASA